MTAPRLELGLPRADDRVTAPRAGPQAVRAGAEGRTASRRLELGLALVVLAGLAYPAARAIAAERARAMTREARDNVDLLFHGTAAHFALARPRLGAAAHRCPHPKDHPEGGAIAITPPLTVRCADGPDGACTPSASDRPGAYDPALWNDPVWRGLGFRKLEGHRFHFAYEAVNLDDGYGACEFTVTARADLDGDGVYSTYRRSGRADQRGVRPTTPLVIDAPFE